MRRAFDIALERLVEAHGFEVIEQIEPDPARPRAATLRGWVDADNAVIADLRVGGHTSINYGIQRRDLKGLFAELIPETYDETSPSVQPYAERAPARWREFEEAEAVVSYIDEWTPQYRTFATLAVVTKYYESEAGLTSMIPADGWNRGDEPHAQWVGSRCISVVR